MQKNEDGTVTFNLQGYKPVVCRCVGYHIKDTIKISTYETALDKNQREVLNCDLVSKVIKQLNTLQI